MDIQAFSIKWIKSLQQINLSLVSSIPNIEADSSFLSMNLPLDTAEIEMILNHLDYKSWPRVLRPPSLVSRNDEEVQVIQKLSDLQSSIRKHHDNKENQEKARNLIPVDLLSQKAEFRMKDSQEKGKPMEMDQALILELLNWFKHSFFQWVDKLPCETCNPLNQISVLHGIPTPEERNRGVLRVELHQCVLCKKLQRFPRLNHPVDLLKTKKGRCGEWANCFLLVCKALGFEARYVLDWNDHIWNEIKIPSLQRWVHIDSCENLLDAPLVYCLGWKKQLKRVYAVDSYYVLDVFHRYTNTEAPPLKSLWLNYTEKKLCAYGLKFSPNKLATLLDQVYAFLDTKVSFTSGTFQSRKSGDASWKASRGECRIFPEDWPKLQKIELQNCILVGDSKIKNEILELTPNITNKCGGIWLPQTLTAKDSFCIEWTMKISGNGADGLALVVQGSSPNSIGEGGCGLGYVGIPKSFAIEFDTFYSPEQGDPDDNHISLQSCYFHPNSSHHDFSLISLPFPKDLNLGILINLRLLYRNSELSIWLKDESGTFIELFSYVLEFSKFCNVEDKVFLGFTASTGGISQCHEIQSIAFVKF